jgi:hypothetical protein
MIAGLMGFRTTHTWALNGRRLRRPGRPSARTSLIVNAHPSFDTTA